MTVHSQNGWPAFHTPAEGKFVRFNAGGRGWWAANADVAVVAGEYITRFDQQVERVVQPEEKYDDWSFADRLVRGSTKAVSNHGSATAWDVNATRHLLGADNTFSDADEARLRAIVADLADDAGRPVLRWGGSYSGRLDEMHVEVIGTPEQLRQAANKIRSREDDDMKLTDDVKLGPKGQRRMGGAKTADVSLLLQGYNPGVRAARDEVAAGFKAVQAQLGAQQAIIAKLLAALADGGSLTAEQAEAAAEAGARAALGVLGRDLVDTDDDGADVPSQNPGA